MILLKYSKAWLIKNKLLFLGVIILFAISSFYLNKVFAVRFADEEDNLVLGHFLIQNQKLYSELFYHHQPLGYILSAGFQFLTGPEDIYELVKTHREVMIAWSLLWCLLLVW